MVTIWLSRNVSVSDAGFGLGVGATSVPNGVPGPVWGMAGAIPCPYHNNINKKGNRAGR
jgi:hypothetical protein